MKKSVIFLNLVLKSVDSLNPLLSPERNETMFDKQLFEELLKKPEWETLDFKRQQYDFTGSKSKKEEKTAEFVKDIVSFANTIRFESAYIIIGIEEDKKTKEINRYGISKSDYIDGAEFAQKFYRKVDPHPKFTCDRYIDDEGKFYEIIEIPIYPYPKPCTTIRDIPPLEIGQVYIRRGSSKDSANKLEIDRIQGWLDSLPIQTEQKQQALFEIIRTHSRQKYEKTLKREYSHHDISETILSNIKNTRKTFQEAVQNLWGTSKSKHAVVIGEGGMGKTTSFLTLWKNLLSSNAKMPIPIYIALQDYNREKPERRRDFIWHKIIRDYRPVEDDIQQLEKLFNHNEKKNIPSFVLLLDGFNEVNIVDKALIDNLVDFTELDSVQILISSRYDVTISLPGFHKLYLEDLTNQQIQDFMQEEGEAFDEHLLQEIPLLRNPMMLTLYCAAEKEMQTDPDSSHYPFIRPPRYKAEIFYNYFMSQQSRLDKRPGSTPSDKALHYLYLHHLLPRIGYDMEMNHLFKLSDEELWKIIEAELEKYRQRKFIQSHEVICNAMPQIGKLLEPNDENVTTAIRILREGKIAITEKLFGGEAIHQDYRAYFAAAYMKTSLETFLKTGDIIHVEYFQEHLLAPHLRKMLGELTGEPRRRPVLKDGYQSGELSETLLDRILDLLRANPPKPCSDYTLLNVIEILKDTRKDLSDTNLSCLDLRHVMLNNVRLGHYESCGANVSGSLVNTSAFLPQWHERWVNAVCYSPDGKKFLSAGEDGIVKEWNTISGECVATYGEALSAAACVCYSPDGKKIAVGYKDEMIREWGITDQKDYLETYAGHEGEITSVCYSLDGTYLFSHSTDGTSKQWETESGECLITFEGHTGSVPFIVNPKDQSQIASGSDDGTIRIWNIEFGECKEVLGIFKLTQQALDELKRVIFKLTAQSLEELNADKDLPDEIRVEDLWFLEDKEFIMEDAFLTAISEQIEKEQAEQHEAIILKHARHQDIPDKIAEALNALIEQKFTTEKTFLTAVEEHIGEEGFEKYHELVLKYALLSEGITALAYSSDGKKLVAGSKDATIREWDVQRGTCLHVYKGHLDSIASVCYNADRSKIFSSASSDPESTLDTSIKAWDMNTGEEVRTFQEHERGVNALSYNPKAKTLVSASYDNTIKEWDLRSGECIRTYRSYPRAISCVQYSRDGKTLISGNPPGTIKRWNKETGKCLQVYQGISQGNPFVRFSADEQYIFLIGDDGVYEKWGTETGECLLSRKQTNEKVFCFSPDGERVLSADQYGTIHERKAMSGEHLNSYPEASDSKRIISWLCYRSDGNAFLAACQNIIEEWEIGAEESQTHEVKKRRITSATLREVSELKEQPVEAGKAEMLESLSLFNTLADEGKLRSELNQSGFTQNEIKTILDRGGAETITHLQISFVCYSPDEQNILFVRQEADGKNVIEEWKRSPWTYLRDYKEGAYPQISSVRYSPDGKKILAASQNLVLEWDTAEYDVSPREYEGFPRFATVTSVDYSPDGTHIIAGGTDNTIREWDTTDTTTGEYTQTIQNIFGLLVQGVDMSKSHFDPEISDKERKILQQYGVIF